MKKITAEEYRELFHSPEEKENTGTELFLSEHEDFRLPRRNPAAHKYSFGRAVIIAGSKGFSGAPVLAANACERSGAGLTRLLVPESIYGIAAARCDGAVVSPLKSNSGGCISAGAIDIVLNALEKADACAIGPGIGTGEDAGKLVAEVLKYANCPVILDADALTVCGRNPQLLTSRKSATILTPHTGEFKRIGGDLANGRLRGAEDYMRNRKNTVLLLKGSGTVIADGDRLYVNPTGNPGMAKGGSGDVLCGTLCALLAQHFEPVFSARCAAFLHGLAGDMACAEKGEYSIIPSDIIDKLPEAFKSLQKE